MDIRPSTHYHPLPNRLINRATRLLNALGRRPLDLSEDGLLAAARKDTGLADFGDERFLPALRALLAAQRDEAALNPFGRIHARTKILGTLRNRLWAQACFSAYPEIRKRKIAAPIVIIGPHRSGTTRLHRMLASDVRLQHLTTWEGFNPAPRLGQTDLGKAARFTEVDSAFKTAPRFYPGAFVGHPMAAEWAEEEMLLLNHSFCSFSFLGEYTIPSFYKWYLDCDRSFAYEYMADLLRLISWSRGAPEGQPWVLKDPQHMLDLGALLKVFPDARLVFTHRDPLKTVASIISLMWHFSVQHTDRPCRQDVRDVWLDFCEQAARRCMAARDGIPPEQQIDVHYDEMNRDWRGVMSRVYAHAGLEFTAAAEQALGGWLKKSEQENRHGGHRYALEDFGLAREEVDTRLKFVRDAYGIEYEGARR
ncbi:MAG TPA: sulfotransferase [Rhodocyclaceae bacterium]